MRTLPPQAELYKDAISLPPHEWMKKYKVHKDYRPYINEFSFFIWGNPMFELHSDLNPKLFMGWVRLFLLGTQLASEEKGFDGRSPAAKYYLNVETVTDPDGEHDDKCSAYYFKPPENNSAIAVTNNNIKKRLSGPILADAHFPDRHLDFFQSALTAGIEEGLHAESYKIPTFVGERKAYEKVEIPPDATNKERAENYAKDFAENYIHDDLVRAFNKLNLKYDRKQYHDFMKRNFPEVVESWKPHYINIEDEALQAEVLNPKVDMDALIDEAVKRSIRNPQKKWILKTVANAPSDPDLKKDIQHKIELAVRVAEKEGTYEADWVSVIQSKSKPGKSK